MGECCLLTSLLSGSCSAIPHPTPLIFLTMGYPPCFQDPFIYLQISFFLYNWIKYHCVYVVYFQCPFISWWTSIYAASELWLLLMEQPWTLMCVSLWWEMEFLGYMPRSGVTSLYGRPISGFVKVGTPVLQGLHQFSFPPAVHWDSSFPTSSFAGFSYF